MTNRAVPVAAVLAALAAASLAGCGAASPASTRAPAPPASSAPAVPVAAPSPAASAAPAKACAELSAWQKAHGNSAAPPQNVFNDLINAPQPLSGDFFAWDLAAGTSQPDAESDLLKVWTDCAKAEAAALAG